MKVSSRKFLTGYMAGAVVMLALIGAVAFVNRSANASNEPGTFVTITAQELKSMVDFGGVTVIDVRDSQSYLAAHIPGALQIPVAMIEGEAAHLPKDKPIVTYCTCPNEESSGQAAMILARSGVKQVFALQGGLGAWTSSGQPTRTGIE